VAARGVEAGSVSSRPGSGQWSQSAALYARARRLIPGGVNSPVRAMRAVGLEQPLFVARGEGAYLVDVDGNRYVDWMMSWGPLVFGHGDSEVVAAIHAAASEGTTFGAPTEREVELAAEIVEAIPSVEMVRLVSSGTEAAMSAVRLARGFVRRDRILKFAGCYHGHADALLASAGSGLATLGIPSSPGVPSGATGDTIVCHFNDVDAAAAAVERYGEGLAAIIVEPVAGNMGVIPPAPGFLEALRALCDASGALLVFDEVMSGFRVARGGAEERYGIRPDLTVLAKVVGGGLPLAAFGGRADVMERLAPSGDVYQAGTLSGNPLATAAALVALRRLRDAGVYADLEEKGARLEQGLAAAAGTEPVCIQRVGAMATLFFHPGPVRDFRDASAANTERFAGFFRHMLDAGVYLPPSQFEALFISTAHGDEEIERTVAAAADFFSEAP
jgi:glutamate-1-semialdehyde 2,1-aminomutase